MTGALLLGRATAWHASYWVNSYCHHPDHDTLEGGTKEQKSPPSSSGTSKRNGNGKSSNFCVARHLPYRWLAAYSLGETWRHDRHRKTYPPGAKKSLFHKSWNMLTRLTARSPPSGDALCP